MICNSIINHSAAQKVRSEKKRKGERFRYNYHFVANIVDVMTDDVIVDN